MATDLRALNEIVEKLDWVEDSLNLHSTDGQLQETAKSVGLNFKALASEAHQLKHGIVNIMQAARKVGP